MHLSKSLASENNEAGMAYVGEGGYVYCGLIQEKYSQWGYLEIMELTLDLTKEQ